MAFVDLATDSVWLFEMSEMANIAQQQSGGRYHLYMYVDATATPRITKPARMADFEDCRLHLVASQLFRAYRREPAKVGQVVVQQGDGTVK